MSTSTTDSGTVSAGPATSDNAPIIEAKDVAKMYGDVLAIHRMTLSISGGLVGLLGPNAAGKSTLMRILIGEIRPTRGTALVLGEEPFGSMKVKKQLGFAPEEDGLYPEMTGLDWVSFLTQLHGYSPREARDLAKDAVNRVGLEKESRRAMGGYSRGMCQRIKIAQAIAHHPSILVLDEPLNGCDPVVKASLREFLVGLARDGVTVLLSSHNLDEVESMTDRIVLINHGSVVADGRVNELRDLLDRHPRTVRVELMSEVSDSTELQQLAASLLQVEGAQAVRLDRATLTLKVETSNVGALFDGLGEVVVDHGHRVRRVTSEDEDLAAVFKYIIGEGGRAG